MAEHGFKWRGLPKRLGHWNTIHTRMSRWATAGLLDRVFEEMQKAQIVHVKIEAVSRAATRSSGCFGV